MPYQVTQPVDFASAGLITDMPAHALPQGAWNDCLNIRVKDGSVQGVNDFETGFAVPVGEPIAVTQWTPAGSSYLNIAYIVKDTGSVGRVYVYNAETQVHVEITSGLSEYAFTIDDAFTPQIFVFNGLLIVNPATEQPQYISADQTTVGVLTGLPGWPTYVGDVPAIARVIRPYKNRLVAMSFLDDRDTVDTSDDSAYPIDFAWSSHITTLDSLSGVEWLASTVNTAGDAFLTQTPGRILDGGQLGEFFIAYKTDGVVRVYETGDNLVLGFDSIFEDDGIYSTRCFANIGDAQHLVIGNYGVYLHDGQSQRQDLAKGVFQDAMYSLVNGTDKDRSFVFQQTRDKEVWFCFRESGTTGAGCNKAFVFNYSDQKVHIRSLPDVSDIYETEIDGSLKIYAAKPDTGIQVLSDTLLIPDGWFTRVEDSMGTPSAHKDLNSIYPESNDSFLISLVGAPLKLSGASMETLFDSKEKIFDPSTSYKVDTRESGRFINLRVTMLGDLNPELTSMQFSIKTSSRR